VRFSLRKWYLDCVTAAGETVVLYQARLSWGPLALRYAGVLGGHTTLRATPEPSVDGDTVSWNAPRLALEGTWRAVAPERRESLLPGVEWRCVQPRARVSLQIGGRKLTGLGYVELLTLSIPPWRLPIDELRWGRFCSEERGAVWIEWRGPHPLRVALVDGARADFDPETLRLHDDRVLRSGRIGKTVIPRLKRLFPSRIARLSETKWLSRGSLAGSEGWAIHEVVRWPP
jgi:hypothetical protein